MRVSSTHVCKLCPCSVVWLLCVLLPQAVVCVLVASVLQFLPFTTVCIWLPDTLLLAVFLHSTKYLSLRKSPYEVFGTPQTRQSSRITLRCVFMRTHDISCQHQSARLFTWETGVLLTTAQIFLEYFYILYFL